MDAVVFFLLLGGTFSFFLGAYRASGKSGVSAVVFGMFAAMLAMIATMAVVSDTDGIVLVSRDAVTYTHTDAAALDKAPAPPEFEWRFGSAADLDGWHQSRYLFKASSDDEFGWTSDHGGSIKVTADTSRDDRFNGIYLAKIERQAGHEWSTLSFDYRITGQPERHGLIVGWSCDACFASESDTIVSAPASTADSGWQSATLDIPITEKDLIVAWYPPLLAAQGGLYSERSIWLDNVEIRTAGLTVSSATGVSTIEHGNTSAGRYVLTAEATESRLVLIGPSESNRMVLGTLLLAWSAFSVLFLIGQFPSLLNGGKPVGAKQ